MIAHEPSRLTVAILTKDQGHGIGTLVDAVRPYAAEILVVDGHSTDGTLEIAARHGARPILDGGGGKGDGVRSAIEAATGEALAFMDGDGSCEIRDIAKLAAPVLAGEAQLSIGSRMRGGSEEPHATLSEVARLLGATTITVLINYLFGVRLTDGQNGFRVIRLDAARSLTLREQGAAIELEMLLACLRRGYVVCETASHEYPRRYGASSLLLRRDWARVLRCLLIHVF